MNKPELNRRSFISKSSLGALGALTIPTIITSCKGGESKKEKFLLPELLDQAPDGPLLKAGLIGCGGQSRPYRLRWKGNRRGN